MIAENLPDAFSKVSLRAGCAVVRNSRILNRPGKQEEMPTLNGGLSDVPNKDGAKVWDDAVETAAVDQAERRFQWQIFAQRSMTLKVGR